jgi:uncharacterized repeat protein (TIGR02543 family)
VQEAADKSKEWVMRQFRWCWAIAIAAAIVGVCRAASDDYLVVDLSAGPGGTYPITYTNAAPPGGWTDAHKTSKLVLRKLPRGTFTMGSPTNEAGRVTDGLEDQRSVTLSNDFYIGLFEMTEGQCSRLNTVFDFSAGSKRPAVDVASISFSELVGDAFSRLVNGTATNFALPNEAQWEYACRAGSDLAYCFGSDTNLLSDYAWYNGVSQADVGLKSPNAYGLYDMHGNAAEAVENLAGSGRWLCGGSSSKDAGGCRSAVRGSYNVEGTLDGFRVCLTVPLKLYTVTVTNGTAEASSGTNGQVVAIWADPPASLNAFDRWAGDTQTVQNVYASNTTVRIQDADVALTATYRSAPFTLTVVNGTGSGQYDAGDSVSVEADTPAPGTVFAYWSVVPGDAPLGDVFDPLKASTSLTMPPLHTIVTAVYEDIPTYRLTVNGGTGGGIYTNGQIVTIYASPPPANHTFVWAGDVATVADPTERLTTLVMPAADITVTATYPPVLYPLTVHGGTGGGSYTNGQTVTVTATNQPSSGHVFESWSGDTNGMANVSAPTTTVTVAGAAELTPFYRPLPMPDNTFLVVDLTAPTPEQAVSYRDDVPAGGWVGTYLTNRLVLRKIPAGTFVMGSPASEAGRFDNESQHTVTLTTAFYLGLFEVTQAQWYRLKGDWPSYASGTSRLVQPVERVSYVDIRGATNSANWPSTAAVDADSFMGRLRAKTGDDAFDLPTEAQWEYACRAGTTGRYAGTGVLPEMGWYSANSGGGTKTVGQKAANAWGLHDMHGNVHELCLDWSAGNYSPTNQSNPPGAIGSLLNRRIMRGGTYHVTEEYCRSAYRGNLLPTNKWSFAGLRVARPVGATYRLTIEHGLVNTGGWFVAGTQIPVSPAAAAGWAFASWQATPAGASLGPAYQSASRDTVLTMPAQAVTLVATYTPTLPLTVTLDPAGGTLTPATLAVGLGGAYGGPFGGALPAPTRLGHTFQGWRTEPDGAGDEVTGATVIETAADHTLYAHWSVIPSQPPVFTRRSPLNGSVTLNEGASLSLSVSANDNADPDTEQRGMSNITWTVDGVLTQTTSAGAPGAVSSTLSYRTGAGSVSGAAFREVQIQAVALDRLGGSATAEWLIRVVNMPAAQTITFGSLPTVALEAADFDPGATANSGLPVAYASSDESVAQVVGGLLHIVGAGAATITASQPGDFDFKAATPVRRTLAVKARLTAEVPAGGGTVSGAGLYSPGAKVTLKARPATGYTFLRWEDGSQATSRTLVIPGANVTVSAWFGLTADVPPPAVGNPGSQQAMMGVYCRLPLDVQSESLPSVTLSNLPSGLRYNANAKTVEGVPTAAVSDRLVTLKATNASRVTVTETFTLTVLPLPAWAQGTFAGSCLLGDGTAPGAAELTVTLQGKISGKLSAAGTNYTFQAGSYTNGGAFAFETLAEAGQAKIPLAVTVTHPDIYPGGPAGLGVAEGRLDGVTEGEAPVALWRNVWKDADMAAAATNYTGYYTAALPGGADFGSGYLLFTVDKAGGVKLAGKLADGTSVSLSRSLILDEDGRVFAVLHASPSAYKGGCFFGVAEFVRQEAEATLVRVLEDGSCLWVNRNPLATADTAAGGFSRTLELTGGWYDKVSNLYAYYAGQALAVGTAGAPTPELAVGASRVESVWWDPDGLVLEPVTNRYGVMTGLAAPRTVTPARVDGVYDYEGPTNTVGLTVTLTRATGVFKGSFKAWFDTATTHTYKRVAYEGVLTPEREGTEDGTEGWGFFLWADKSGYDTGKVDRYGNPITATYTFNRSYNFLLAFP